MSATLPLRHRAFQAIRFPHTAGPGVEPRRHRRARRSLMLDIAVAPVLIAAIWLGIGVDLSQKRAAAAAAATRNSADLAYAASASVSQALASVDQTLLSLRAAYAAEAGSRGPAGFDLRKWSRIRFADQQAFQLLLIDRQGMLAGSNLGPSEAPLDVSARPEFSGPNTREGDALFIGTAPPGGTSGRLSLRFSRKLFSPTGRFEGVAAMALDPAWLSRAYGALDDGRGFFMLAGTEGSVLSAAPLEALAIGADGSRLELFAAAAGDEAGTLTTARLRDGVERIVSYRHLRDYSLVVAVGLDAEPAMAGYRGERREYLIVGAALSLVMLLLGALLVDHKRRLLLSQEDLSAAVENISQGVALIDVDGRVPVLNRRAVELCGLPEELGERSSSLDEILALQLGSGEFAPGSDYSVALRNSLSPDSAMPIDCVYERRRANGVVLEVRTRRLPQGGAVRTFTDVTERRRAEDHIRRLAHYDPLTGLANRHLLHDEMERALDAAAQGGPPVAVIFLDLDRFKAVNDTLGHAAGDRVLIEVADRLRATTGERDIIARLGGDEFVVVQTGSAQPAGSMALAHRLIERVSAPYDIAGQPVSVGTSVGIALPTAAGESIDRLLSNADAALYLSKSAGRGMVRMFDREMDERQRGRRELVLDLRAAIAADQIEAHYQPIFTCATGEIAGFEALARWTHPVHGVIPPGEFISLAEEHGLIHTLGRSVLLSACTAATTWPERLRLAVNLSATQVRGGSLAKTVGDVLRQSGLAASRLELEITERALIENTDQALEVFRGLRSLGVRVALDEFGTGYSSLAYLRLFPFDKIKIDGSFIRGLENDPAAGTIVQAILGMGRTMQAQVSAEGVETEMQLAILRQQRCAEVQGNFLGHPGPACTLGRFLGGDRPRVAAVPKPVRAMARQTS